MKRLPGWLKGAEVSDLTYDVAASVFEIPGRCSPAIIAEHLGVDEADVLRSYAELERVGVLETSRERESCEP